MPEAEPQPLPVLLPTRTLPQKHSIPHIEWTPKRYKDPPQPPPTDDARAQEQELAYARQFMDGKLVKKTRPRRTVDFNGGLGRWNMLRKLRPNPLYTHQMRPCPPSIINLLPPKAYPENASTSLCTKFVHTSTNKIRCPVNVVTWTPEGRRILTGSTSGEFTLWNGLTFNFETILQAHDTAVCTLSFTHSGAYLASADKTGIIKYFEPNMNNLTAWQGSNSREAIRGISFSPDDRRFATASDDSSVRIWSFQESRVESVLTGHGWDVKCVQWHPTKGLIVSGSKDNQIKFWDPRTGTVLSTLHQHKNTIQALAWSPNGNLVASASRDQTVRVFDIRAMKEYRVLKGHKKEVCSVAWHPVHPILVSGGSEGSIIHWDLSSEESSSATPFIPPSSVKSKLSDLPAHLALPPTPTTLPRATLSEAHDSNVWSLAFHPLGHLLVSASNDHTTRFWSRERPGDSDAVFSAGGEKPPAAVDGADGGWDDEDMAVPGFGGAGTAGGWYGKEDEVYEGGVNGTNGGGASYGNGSSHGQNGYDISDRGGFSGPGADDDFSIPGIGDLPGFSSTNTNSARMNGPLPSQEEAIYGPDSNANEWYGGDRERGSAGDRGYDSSGRGGGGRDGGGGRQRWGGGRRARY
ncbi:WD40-repeat-containing domain protein [Lentinula detonsa]|uniref:Polyadenylation factor subunit 2 n=1 Tax=Lentinula detonsa TaxID=2804962 RepID=A0A9W8P4I3_9AGAR|nr:WD40-repeat-containing domain protein [Lentinula detonsa]